MDYIKKYWEKQGDTYKDSHWASWGDRLMINLEIETIAKHIGALQKILDVGCGNGYSTLKQAENNPSCTFRGIDYSANLIAQAIAKRNEKKLEATFVVMDARVLPYKEEFDVVYTTRTLINLPTWEEQKQVIDLCIAAVKPEGKVILSEAFWEPMILLNALRAVKNLPPLVTHDFNRYLIMSQLKDYLRYKGLNFYVEDFSSIYYLGTRFLRELIDDEEFQGKDFENPLNKAFYELEKKFSGGGLGIQQAVIITSNVV